MEGCPEKHGLLGLPGFSKTPAGILCVIVIFCCDTVIAAPSSDSDKPDTSSAQPSDRSLTIAACVGGAAFLTLTLYILAFCTDCYNSEVSSELHPATGQSGAARWGGAGGYTAAASTDVNDTILGAGFTDQVVVPGNSQALPYTMIPSQVPEAQGFRGYGAGPPSTAQGLVGYGGGGVSGYGGGGEMGQGGGVRAQNLPGAHTSPVNEPEEPPPPYSSASGW